MKKLKQTNVDIYESETINMLPDRKYGGLRKRLGYKKLDHYPGRINCIYQNGDDLYVHAADYIYLNGNELMPAQDRRSQLSVSGGVVTISYDGPFTEATIEDVTYYLKNGAICSRQDRTYTTEYKVIKKIPNEDLKDSFALIYDNYYIVFCPSNNAYALDIQYLKVYKLEDIFCRVAAVIDGRLYIGDIYGNFFKFNNEPTKHSSYSDNGRAIIASLKTKPISGTSIGKRKDFRNIDVILGCVSGYKVKIYGRGAYDLSNRWKLLCNKSLDFIGNFDFSTLDFGNINFCNRRYELPCIARIFLGIVYSAEFMLVEDSLNTPFNIKSIDIGYYEGGRFY